MPRATIADQTLKLRAIASVAPCNVELTPAMANRLLKDAVERCPECQRIIDLAAIADPREALRAMLIEYASNEPATPRLWETPSTLPMQGEPALVSNAADVLSLAVYARNPRPWGALHELASFFGALIPKDTIRQAAFKQVAPHAVALFDAAKCGGSNGVHVAYSML